MVTKGQILEILPKLTRTDLEQVHATAGSLLGGATGAAESGPTGVAEVTFNALVTALGLSMPYSALPTDIARRFKNAVPPLVKFLDSNFPGWASNKITQLAFLRMLFGLLVDDLKGRGVTPRIGMIVVNMVRLPEVFNAAFPDYLEAGLGGIILNQYVKSNRNRRASIGLNQRVAK